MTQPLRKLDHNGIPEFNTGDDLYFAKHVAHILDDYKKAKVAVERMEELELTLLQSKNLNMAAFVAFYDLCGFRWIKGEELLLRRGNPDEICYFLYWNNNYFRQAETYWKEAIDLVLEKGNKAEKIQAYITWGHHVGLEQHSAKKARDEVKVARLENLLQEIFASRAKLENSSE